MTSSASRQFAILVQHQDMPDDKVYFAGLSMKAGYAHLRRPGDSAIVTYPALWMAKLDAWFNRAAILKAAPDTFYTTDRSKIVIAAAPAP